MAGHKRWWVLIVLALGAVVVLGGLATQLELSRAKEHTCGTPLRIDQQESFRLSERAVAVQNDAGGGAMTWEEGERQARSLEAQAAAAADRCNDRQVVALLGLGAGGAAVTAAIALSTYQLGRRAGRRQGAVGEV